MMRLALSCLVAALPTFAAAQAELRATPDYFASAVFDMSMAQALGRACSTVSVDPMKAAERSTALLAALEADGFSTDTPHQQMTEPDAAIRSLQEEFVKRHALSEPDEARVCEVARSEILDETGIGQLLVEMAQ